MSTLSSANVTDVNLVLKERTHMRLCINMLIFTHNVGNWLVNIILFCPPSSLMFIFQQQQTGLSVTAFCTHLQGVLEQHSQQPTSAAVTVSWSCDGDSVAATRKQISLTSTCLSRSLTETLHRFNTQLSLTWSHHTRWRSVGSYSYFCTPPVNLLFYLFILLKQNIFYLRLRQSLLVDDVYSAIKYALLRHCH